MPQANIVIFFVSAEGLVLLTPTRPLCHQYTFINLATLQQKKNHSGCSLVGAGPSPGHWSRLAVWTGQGCHHLQSSRKKDSRRVAE